MSTALPTPPTRYQILDTNGEIVDGAPDLNLEDEKLLAMYEDMLLARRFDRRVVSLSRQGRIGTYPPMYGHEAVQIASAHALDAKDWVVPSYRDHGALMVQGLPLKHILLYFMGDEAGNAIPDDVNALPINGSVGSQLLHAMGMAWADVLTDDIDAVYCPYFGDGATSEGFAQEAMNFAGVFDTPNVFICENNGWAISVPRSKQTAAETIAQRAHNYGFDGYQIDGMDPLAVYHATEQALANARDPGPDGSRPTLIEAVLYRLGPHSTADDPTNYRDEAEVEQWKDADPLPRFEQYLRDTGRLDAETHDAMETRVEARIEDAVDAAEATDDTAPQRMFEHAYAEMPSTLEEQATFLHALRDRYGDELHLED